MKKEQLKVTTMMRPGLLPPAPPGIGRGRPLNGPKMEKQMSTIGRLPSLPTPTSLPGIGRGRARHSGPPQINLDPSCFSDASVSKI